MNRQGPVDRPSGHAARLPRATGGRSAVLRLAILITVLLWGQTFAQDEHLDARDLGPRGVSFSSPTERDGIYHSSTGVGSLGDVDLDGFDDVFVVFRERYDADEQRLGFYLLFGSVEGPGARRSVIRARSPEFPATAYFIDASPLPDLTGDGMPGFVMSATGKESSGRDAGRIVLARGGSHLRGDIWFDEIPGVELHSTDSEYGALGWQAKYIGDFTGTGRPTVAVSAPSTDALGFDHAGAVYVLPGVGVLEGSVNVDRIGTDFSGLTLLGFLDYHELLDHELGSTIGWCLSPIGDFNGDGRDDLLIGSPHCFPARYWIVLGRSEFPAEPIVFKEWESDDERRALGIIEILGPKEGLVDFGSPGQGAGIGDWNGDGFADIALGASYQCCPLPSPSRFSLVQVFFGRPDFPWHVEIDDFASSPVPEGLGVTIRPVREENVFGSDVSGAGDFNGDGLGDLVIGEPNASYLGRTFAGRAYIVFGRRNPPSELSLRGDFDGVVIDGPGEYYTLGAHVGSAGDVNADGFDDVIVSSARIVNEINVKAFPGVAQAHVIFGTRRESGLVLRAVEPSSGPVAGGSSVTLFGSGFKADGEFRIGGVPAPVVRAKSSGEVVLLLPRSAHAGRVAIEVTIDGEHAELRDAFAYVDFPGIDLEKLGEVGYEIRGEPLRRLGIALTAGDLDGDGFDEVIASETSLGGVQSGDWHVLVYGGGEKRTGLLSGSDARAVISSPDPSDVAYVRAIGDVDADGYEDLFIGLQRGVSYIVFGAEEFVGERILDDAAGRPRFARIIREVARESSIAFVASPLGDITGDGIDDFAVAWKNAAENFDSLLGEAGDVLIFSGRREWPEDLDTFEFHRRVHGRDRFGEHFGGQIEPAGDVDGDGLEDLLVGRTDSFLDAYLIYGAVLGGTEAPENIRIDDLVAGGGAVRFDFPGSWGGWLDLAPAGDVNSDGFADFLAGTSVGGRINEGFSFLVWGRPKLPNIVNLEESAEDPAWDGLYLRIPGDQSPLSTADVAPAGDVNADGFADFVIAAHIGFPPDPGHAYLIFGSSEWESPLSLTRLRERGVRIDGFVELSSFNAKMHEVVDQNGDGISDLVLHDQGHPPLPGEPEGQPSRIFVVYGEASSRPFLRGDVSADGRLGLDDAILILGDLFQGERRIQCKDAADVDDDGRVLLTDAIRVLLYLFLSGDPPAAPWPDAGFDETLDELGACR